jgi:hypothetical protein
MKPHGARSYWHGLDEDIDQTQSAVCWTGIRKGFQMRDNNDHNDKMMAGIPAHHYHQKSTSGPLTQYERLGITNPGMTNYERMVAVSEYWKQQRKTGQLKPKKAVYESKPESPGCQCDGAGWYIGGSPAELRKCNCGIAGPSPEESRLNSELSVMAHKNFDNFDLDRP